MHKYVSRRASPLQLNSPTPHAPAAGFHYAKSLLHTVQQKVGLETDPADVLNEVCEESCAFGSLLRVLSFCPGGHMLLAC